MPIRSLNPATEKVFAEFPALNSEEIEAKLSAAEDCFHAWRRTSFAERAAKMSKLAKLLRAKKTELGLVITREMGKPIAESEAEIEKCAWCAEYFADNAEKFLAPEKVETDAAESFVSFEPIGIVLAVMPWNFPFWQVIRFIAPAAMAGNVGLLKHASNVPQCALALERIFLEAGFPEGVFQSLLIGSSQVAALIQDERIKAVTLTGSETAGREVATEAGRNLKKTVLELGGSNPFVILKDADLELAVKEAVRGRFQNTGQSCIAAKRFIVEAAIAAEFLARFKTATEELKVGDPENLETQIGPLSSLKGLQDLSTQVEQSVRLGAEIITGATRLDRSGYFYAPTILSSVRKGMPAYDEETFGPVAAVIIAKDEAEAIRIANDTPYGLGASLFTQDLAKAKRLIPEFETSTVFINGIVKSDPRLPFGGIKRSGYGRELASYGIREFVNVKPVWIK